MAAEKTRAIILKLLPFRETSCILHLFTEEHGLVHGIAKGVRGKKAKLEFLERGFCIESLIYIKPHRDLHTIANFSVLEHFPEVRENIIKGALRDTAFETILASITETDEHPELFTFFIRFLCHLQKAKEEECNPFALWLFYHRFSQHMGFGLELDTCLTCSNPFNGDAQLMLSRGGLQCLQCFGNTGGYESIPHEVISYLNTGTPKPHQLQSQFSSARLKSITRLFADYCRYHFDTQKEYKALAFLEDMTP